MDFTVAWLSELLASLEDRLSDEQQRSLLARCSHACTAPWAEKAAELRQQSPPESDTASLLSAFCAALPGGGPEVHVDGPHITWSFAPSQCPCPVGQATRNAVVCLCGTEHVRGMVEALLARPLAVTLERSLRRGDACCSYHIEVREP